MSIQSRDRSAVLRVAALAAGVAAAVAACSSSTSTPGAGHTGGQATTAPATSSAPGTSASRTITSPATGTSSAHATRTASPPGSHPAGQSGSAAAMAATCKHVASLRASLANLNHLSLNANSASQIRKDLTNISAQLSALRTQAGGAFSAEVSQLNAALAQVSKAAQGMTSAPTAAQVQAVINALKNLKAKSASALSQMNAACPQ